VEVFEYTPREAEGAAGEKGPTTVEEVPPVPTPAEATSDQGAKGEESKDTRAVDTSASSVSAQWMSGVRLGFRPRHVSV
jgi:hypothetical protein